MIVCSCRFGTLFRVCWSMFGNLLGEFHLLLLFALAQTLQLPCQARPLCKHHLRSCLLQRLPWRPTQISMLHYLCRGFCRISQLTPECSGAVWRGKPGCQGMCWYENL